MRRRLRTALTGIVVLVGACTAGVASSTADQFARATTLLGPQDCVIAMVGPGYKKDATAINDYFKGLGAQILSVPPPAGGGDPGEIELDTFVKQLAAKKTCIDLILYFSGEGGENGSIDVGKNAKGESIIVRPAIVRKLTVAVPSLTFKIIADACFSGYWANQFKTGPTNVLVVVNASTAVNKYYPGVCGVSNFTSTLIDSMKKQETATANDTSGADKAARLIELGNSTSGWTVTNLKSGSLSVTPPSVNRLPPVATSTGASGAAPPTNATPPGTTTTATGEANVTIAGHELGWDQTTNICNGGVIHLTLTLDGVPPATDVKLNMTGSGLPASLTITVNPGVQVTRDFTVPGSKGTVTWTSEIVSIGGKPPPTSGARVQAFAQCPD